MKVQRGTALAGGAAGAALLLLLPGCLEPFPAHVDPTVAVADLKWVREDCPKSSDGQDIACVGNRHEVDYTFRQGAGPPYPAILQVISVRQLGRPSTEDLATLAQRAVDNGTAATRIQHDASADQEGTRTLRNGLETHWFTQEGVVTSAGTVFRQDVRVRIIGEVAYDGRAHTSIIAVGIAQVGIRQCTPLPLQSTCTTSPDYRSWTSMVGDEAGSVGSAVKGTGLIYNLVTHG